MHSAKRYLLIALSFAICMTVFAAFAPRIAHAITATLVQVVNTPDSQPFSTRLDIAFSGNFGSASFTVPAGKTLVIDYISADANISGDGIAFDVATSLNGAEVESHLPMVPGGVIDGQPYYVMSSPVKIYADGGSSVTIAVLTDGTGGGGLIVGVYGHLV